MADLDEDTDVKEKKRQPASPDAEPSDSVSASAYGTTSAPSKFLFDMHNFDDDFVEEIEEEEPPPPTFSEEELEQAKQGAFKKGREEALAEAESSREKFVAGLMQTITDQIKTLFDEERTRADRYEAEAVLLAKEAFAAVFPAFNEKYGLQEVENMIRHVFETHNEVPGIVIDVHPDYTDDIESLLTRGVSPHLVHGKIDIVADESIERGSCRLRWKNGGAIRDILAVRQEIQNILEQTLAGTDIVTDNNEDNPTPPEEQETAQEQLSDKSAKNNDSTGEVNKPAAVHENAEDRAVDDRQKEISDDD